MARFGDALEVDLDLVAAAERATATALEPLSGRRPDLACVFVCGDDPEEVEAALQRAGELSGAPTTVGCSAGGVIGGGRAVNVAPAVSVWAGKLPGTRLHSFHLEVLRTGDAVKVMGLPTVADEPSTVVLFADPFSFPAASFLEQSAGTLPRAELVGGLASGLRGAASTRLLLDGHVHRRGAVGVLMEGPIGASAVSQGCRPVGPAMTVTAMDGDDTVLSLAGRPAADQLDTIVAELPPEDQALISSGIFLGIAIDEYAEDQGVGSFVTRDLIDVDRSRGSLRIIGWVPVGATVRFLLGDAEIASADLRAVLGRLPVDPVEGGLLVSGLRRSEKIFASPDHDVTAVQSILRTTGVAGFFAAGEIAPVAGRSHLHGFSASLLAFGTRSHAAPD